MIVNMFKKAFLDAWDMLIEFHLPFLRHNETDVVVRADETALLTQLFFPVVGVVCALLAMLLGAILNKFFYQIPAAAVFAGILTYFCVYKDNGRGLAGLMALATLRQKKDSLDHALSALPDSIGDVNAPMATLTLVLAVLFKLFAFFMMAFYGYVYWLAAVLVLEFAIEGDLASLPLREQEQPLLAVRRSKRRYIWFAAGFLVLFVLFKAPVASLLLFAAALGLSYGVKTYCEEYWGGIDTKVIGLTAYVFELFALLLGLVLLTEGRVILL